MTWSTITFDKHASGLTWPEPPGATATWYIPLGQSDCVSKLDDPSKVVEFTGWSEPW